MVTAQALIDEARIILNDPNKQFLPDADMLILLNSGVRTLATEIYAWVTRQTIEVVPERNIYALENECIEIIDAFDNNGYRRPVNERSTQILTAGYDTYYSVDPLTIFRLTPTTIQFVDPSIGTETDGKVFVDINYYYSPNNYSLTDTLDISPDLENLLIVFMQYRAVMKARAENTDWDVAMKNTHIQLWADTIAKYKANNPTHTINMQSTNKLREKGLR